MPRWILYDYKWEYHSSAYASAVETHDLTQIIHHYNNRVQRVIFKPIHKTLDEFDNFCRVCYQFQNLMIVIEEVDQFATSYFCPSNLKVLLDVGRMKGLGLYLTARRTKRVNPDIISNANHVIVFRQIRPEDLEYLRSYIGDAVQQLPDAPQYYFVWYNDYTGQAQLMQKI